MNLNNLTDEEVFIVKWQYRSLSDFKKALMHAIICADEENMLRLSLGFPMEVSAYKRFRGESGWWESVAKKAGVEV